MTKVVKWCALCRVQEVYVDAKNVEPEKDYLCKDCMPMRHWHKRWKHMVAAMPARQRAALPKSWDDLDEEVLKT